MWWLLLLVLAGGTDREVMAAVIATEEECRNTLFNSFTNPVRPDRQVIYGMCVESGVNI